MYAFILVVVAVGILMLNDRQKAAHAKKSASLDTEDDVSSKAKMSSWSHAATYVIGAAIITAICIYGDPKGLMWIPVVLIIIVVIVLLKVFAPLALLYFGRNSTNWVTRNSNGTMQINCPKCGALNDLAEVAAGVKAFECKKCGEKATWK